jgi:hypothetical protein
LKASEAAAWTNLTSGINNGKKRKENKGKKKRKLMKKAQKANKNIEIGEKEKNEEKSAK